VLHLPSLQRLFGSDRPEFLCWLAHSAPTAVWQRSTHPVITVELRSELLAPQGVPPDGSEGNFRALPSSWGSSHAPTSLASFTPLLSFVPAYVYDLSYYPQKPPTVNMSGASPFPPSLKRVAALGFYARPRGSIDFQKWGVSTTVAETCDDMREACQGLSADRFSGFSLRNRSLGE